MVRMWKDRVSMRWNNRYFCLFQAGQGSCCPCPACCFFDRRNGQGFDYAYLYNGMNKVQQSAGRVIRTVNDRGIILLLDERFLARQYQESFRGWFPFETVRLETVGEKMRQFWDRVGGSETEEN